MNLRFRRSGLDFSRRRRKVNKTLAKEVGTWIGEIAIAVLFALVLVYFVGYRADVVGPSMLGTLAEGEFREIRYRSKMVRFMSMEKYLMKK